MRTEYTQPAWLKVLYMYMILALVTVSQIEAQSPDEDTPDKHAVRLLVLGYPFVPTMSEVRYRMKPVRLLRPFGDRLAINTWYMASSAYLVPDPFVEVGLTATCEVIDNHLWTMEIGAGTAVSLDGVENFALPLVAEFLGRRRIGGSPVAIDWRLQTLLYGNGVILDLTVPVHLVIGESRFFLEAVPGFNFGHQFEDEIIASALKFGVAAGLTF